MRLFAALELPDDVVDALAIWRLEASALLSSADWRPVSPHLWHLTLAFYGDVGVDDADDLSEQLSECAEMSPLFHLQTGGFGVFPGPMRPRVFWVGVEACGEDNPLKRLAHCCRRAGHATVRKHSAKEAAFRGHVTLARARGRVEGLAGGSMLTLPPTPEICWHAGSLSLFQSILRPQGPQYRRLEVFKFKHSCNDARGLYVR